MYHIFNEHPTERGVTNADAKNGTGKHNPVKEKPRISIKFPPEFCVSFPRRQNRERAGPERKSNDFSETRKLITPALPRVRKQRACVSASAKN